MRPIKAGLFMSLDGVVQADDDWQFAYFDEELFTALTAGWGDASTVLVGRRSFDGYNRLHQEAPDSPMLAFLSNVERYVVTRSEHDPQWAGTAVIADAAEKRISELQGAPGGGDILVAGSPTLVRWLISRGLLNELTVLLLPIIVGSGDRLFPEEDDVDGLVRRALQLESSKQYGSGVLELRYRPARIAGESPAR